MSRTIAAALTAGAEHMLTPPGLFCYTNRSPFQWRRNFLFMTFL